MPFLRRSSTSHTSAASSVGSSSSSMHSSCDNPQLESLAEALQKELREQNLVKDQPLRMKTIPKAFTGKDAVTILQKLLQDAASSSSSSTTIISREDALEKGSEMMIQFTFFKHASSSDNLLQDSATDLYQFDHNLPSEVRRAKNLHNSHWDKVRLLEQYVECKDRRHMFRVFPNCFIAKEAVDVMMDLKLVKSRREAVYLMKRLNQKVFCCEHVCQEHDFRDEYLFFEFVPSNERMPEPPKRATSPKRSHEKRSKKRNKDATVSIAGSDGTKISASNTVKTEEELKQRNSRRAEGIKNRLADYRQKQQETTTKRQGPQPTQPEWTRLSTVAASC